MRYTLKLVTPPTVEPLTLGQAKDHCRIDPSVTEDDDLIAAMIIAARILAETQLHRKLITQTWLIAIDQFPVPSLVSADSFFIPLSPVQSLTIQYYDSSSVLTTLASTAYEMDEFGMRQKVRPVFGTFWPLTAPRLGAVQMSVVTGFGPLATDVPKSVALWMKCAVAAMYENRELSGVLERGDTLATNQFLDGLLDPYRIVEI